MSRKDYELIAKALRIQSGCGCNKASLIAHELAGALALDNPRFDRGRFLEAVGVK